MVNDILATQLAGRIARECLKFDYCFCTLTPSPELESYVQSEEFHTHCDDCAKQIAQCQAPMFDKSRSFVSQYDDHGDDDSDADHPTSPHDVSEVEARCYHAGLSGRRGPKLVFRTSKDKWVVPEEYDEFLYYMKLSPVYEHPKLSEKDLWDKVRAEVVQLLDQRNILHSSIDLVRFCWPKRRENAEKDTQATVKTENNENQEDREEKANRSESENLVDVKVYPQYGTTLLSPITIWIGVLPDTLTSELAFRSSNDILGLLKQHGIFDVDVVYRESVAVDLTASEPLAPVANDRPSKDIANPLPTALGLPIADLGTRSMHGTIAFYFRVGRDLYGVTARHVFFPEYQGNVGYTYEAGSQRKVILMGEAAFRHFIMSVQAQISILRKKIEMYERYVAEFLVAVEKGGPGAKEATRRMKENRGKLDKGRMTLSELKKFFVKVKLEWSDPKDRVIGHIVWAPPFNAASAARYTKNICVIKLDRKKFTPEHMGNVLEFGSEWDVSKYFSLYRGMQHHVPFEHNGISGPHQIPLRGVLSAADVRKPASKDLSAELMHYVLKHGPTTRTTAACLSGFESHVRKYSAAGYCDSIEMPMFHYNDESGPFARKGDSGSVVVDLLGRSVALLNSGTGRPDLPDISYGTPMHWLWELIQAQFPGASLDFDK
ncbi:hypothetical protein EIP91_006765 [Steccherinum ochraceum]|uniref:Uncharacterized protein n=1 Tax=Steccherinum ochraceum TaxID=92696 RepID=A0A4R0RFU1_9APHY|nr:hypothetical protein EIP91_006765 [Steccherinum ochraceum]